MTPDLAAWLLADDGPIAEDEADARRLLRYAQENGLKVREPRLLGREVPGWHEWPDVERICERTIAECAAKRQVAELALSTAAWADSLPDPQRQAYAAMAGAHFELVRILAQPFAGRPGWRPEWAA